MSHATQRDDDGHAAAHSPLPRSALRLHRHALESIFSTLTLGDLSRVVAVSREWTAAVRSMAPIQASLWRLQWRSLCESGAFLPSPPSVISPLLRFPLLRHIAGIDLGGAGNAMDGTLLNNASLGLLTQHTPNLTWLRCELELTPNEPLILPAKLTSLELRLDDEHTDASINGVLTALTALPSLTRLHLELSAFDVANTVDLALLAACPSLSDFTLTSLNGSAPQLSDVQLKQIRSSLGHLQRFAVEGMTSDNLARLLQPPVTARWQDIGRMTGDARTGELLLTLPTLTKVDLTDTTHVDFLPQLSLLTALHLTCFRTEYSPTWSIPADALLASLVQCTCITELSLQCGFDSAHWSALLAKLTRIRKLTISGGELESLRCFEAGPITQSLQELTMHDLELPKDEVSHLYGLRRLRSLNLDCCFYSRLDDETVDSLAPPTPLLPALTDLFHEWRGSDQPAFLLRYGPSFEWMQQRVSQ